MDYLKLNENVCRICLESNIILNWNEEIFPSCGVSYKDCYYKYTPLIRNDSDCYPTNLCENCSNGLKNAHMLLEKALASFNILRIALDNKYILQDEKALIEIDESALHFSDTKTENLVSNPEEFSINEYIEIERAHFLDITNFETPPETPLEPELVESSYTEYTNNNKTNKRRKKFKAYKPEVDTSAVGSCNTNLRIAETMRSIGDNRISTTESLYYDSQPPKSFENVNRTQKLLTDRLLQQDIIKSCDKKSSKAKLSELKQKREKLCQYCSLKVRDSQLKSHEATHDEKRQRKETCTKCGIKLYDKVALAIHMKIHLENRQKDHKCEFCEKSFFSKGSLNIHRRIHLGLMIKCQICSKEYFRQVDLNKHLVIHSAVPPQKNGEKVKYRIQCRYCNKNISTDSWREHKAAHLNQPQTKCKICDKDFFSRSSCTTHLKRVHRTREFDKFIYYYVDPNIRMSHLMMVQQEKVEKLIE